MSRKQMVIHPKSDKASCIRFRAEARNLNGNGFFHKKIDGPLDKM